MNVGFEEKKSVLYECPKGHVLWIRRKRAINYHNCRQYYTIPCYACSDGETKMRAKKETEMPHDCNGKLVQPGDVVTVRFKVKEISQTETFCNLKLSVENVHKDLGVEVDIWLNAGQTEKVR